MIFKDALLLTHHVNEFDTRERDPRCDFCLEPKNGACASFDAAMILLNHVIHIFAGANDNRFAILSEPVFHITL